MLYVEVHIIDMNFSGAPNICYHLRMVGKYQYTRTTLLLIQRFYFIYLPYLVPKMVCQWARTTNRPTLPPKTLVSVDLTWSVSFNAYFLGLSMIATTGQMYSNVTIVNNNPCVNVYSFMAQEYELFAGSVRCIGIGI